jgi:putative addiction module component (TIGR02574 family)
MHSDLNPLRDQLLNLPAPQRAELAHFLLESLEDEEAGADAVWREEIKRRIEEIKSGKVTGKPAEEVFSRIRERYS